MPATLKIPTIFTAVDKISSVVTKMTSGIKKFSKSGISAVQRLDHKITKTFNKLDGLSKWALGLGLGALFASGFNDIKNFETGMVGVSKTTGIAGQELKDLSKDFIVTSNSMRGIKVDNLTELGQVAGQLGVSGSADILNFASTMGKLEKSTDIVGEEGAANIARLLNLTGEGVSVIDRFGSALVALGNNSAATESEILSVASEVGRSTAAYKLQSSQILGISTALKSLDVRPEAAGTAVGKVFRGIEMATIKGGKTLSNYGKIMGLTSDQVKQTFQKDPEKAFNLFIKGLDRISKSGKSVAKALDNVGLSGETISKGIIPLATNYDMLDDKMSLARKGFKENIALNEEFDSATKTVATGLTEVSKSFSNVLISGVATGSGLEKLREILFYVADNMETIVTVGATLIAAFALMKTIVWGTKAAIFAYNVVIGINAGLHGAMSKSIATNTVSLTAYKIAQISTTGATWLATAATTAFGVAVNLSLWPILAIIAAIVAIILIFKNWSKISAWFGEKWKQFTTWISDKWNAVVKWFKEFDFQAFFKNIGLSIMKFLLTPMTALLTLLSKMPGKIGEMASMGLDKIGEMTGEIDADINQTNPTLPSPESRNSEITQESIRRNALDINLNDPGGMVKDVKSNNDNNIPVKVTNTQGAF